MHSNLSKLIFYIVSYINEHESYVTKTKLLKILYLFDVEYYRLTGEIFTGFDWKYFHLGPWTQEYDDLLDTLISQDSLRVSSGSKGNEFFSTYEKVELGNLFGSFKEERPLTRVLKSWAEESASSILDYVYFQTEPMQSGKRYKRLDFTTVPREEVSLFRLDSSSKSQAQIQAIKEEVKEKLDILKKSHKRGFKVENKPRYDEVFFNAIEELELQNR